MGIGVGVGVGVPLQGGFPETAGPIGTPESVHSAQDKVAGGSLPYVIVTDSPLSTQAVPQSRSRLGKPLPIGSGHPGAFWSVQSVMGPFQRACRSLADWPVWLMKVWESNHIVG